MDTKILVTQKSDGTQYLYHIILLRGFVWTVYSNLLGSGMLFWFLNCRTKLNIHHIHYIVNGLFTCNTIKSIMLRNVQLFVKINPIYYILYIYKYNLLKLKKIAVHTTSLRKILKILHWESHSFQIRVQTRICIFFSN